MNMGRLVVVLLIAAMIAGGVFYVTSSMQAPAPVANVPVAAVPRVSSDTQQVLVAVAAVPAGTLLKQADVQFAFRPWPRASVDDKAYVLEGTAVTDFNGAVVRTGIQAGEPVVRSNLIKPGENGFLAAVLKPGMRAVSVSVNENTGVAGFVFPGDRVDLVLSHAVNIPHADGQPKAHNVSETILHDLRVVAVDQKASDQEQVPAVSSVATLEVTPEQAERVALAQRMGELRLVLRSIVLEAGAASGAGAEVGGTEANPPPSVAPSPLQQAAGPEERTFTLDSDLSQIVSPPAGGDDKGGSRIQVVRGSQSADVESK